MITTPQQCHKSKCTHSKMISLILVLFIFGSDSSQKQPEPSRKILSSYSNRDIVLDQGFFGIWPSLPAALAEDLSTLSKSPRFKDELLCMLDDPKRYGVAQLILIRCFGGWNQTDNAKFPGTFGLEIAPQSLTINSPVRSKELVKYWRSRLGLIPR
jgi:hypothetical protein